uniref:Uncharacterized protein n=1 Tax=Anopheles maculatus TaxID=74869 RepID=A0A182T965_9DIPT
ELLQSPLVVAVAAATAASAVTGNSSPCTQKKAKHAGLSSSSPAAINRNTASSCQKVISPIVNVVVNDIAAGLANAVAAAVADAVTVATIGRNLNMATTGGGGTTTRHNHNTGTNSGSNTLNSYSQLRQQLEMDRSYVCVF